MPALIDRSGQRFGRLLVVDRADSRGGRTFWNCACDCGVRTQVVNSNLNNGHTRSCGCLRGIGPRASQSGSRDLPGQRFGRLTVVALAGRNSDGHLRVLARCDCGGETVVLVGLLRRGATRSCGCLRREMHAVEVPGYGSAHDRVRRERGSARLHACRNCGGPATQWAYDYNDPQELQGVLRGASLRYSAHPEHYLPLCAPCHQRADRRGAWVDGQVRL